MDSYRDYKKIYVDRKPTSALREDVAKKDRIIGLLRKFVRYSVTIGLILGLYYSYRYMEEYAPIWEASVYRLDNRGRPHKVWKKWGGRDISEFLSLLPGILNNDNERLLRALDGVRIFFHEEENPDRDFAGLHDPERKIIHIYPCAKSATILHEMLHYIYRYVLTVEERERFNRFAWRIYELGNMSEAERIHILRERYNPDIKKYLDSVREISQRYSIIIDDDQDRWLIQTELFAAIADYMEYRIAVSVADIYKNYLSEYLTSYLVNPATKDVF